jgi:hypothetical protein
MSPPPLWVRIAARIDYSLRSRGLPRAKLDKLRDVLALEGEAFVCQAWRLVSDRPLESEEIHRFASHLAAGTCKEYLLWYIATSAPRYETGSNPAWLAVLTDDVQRGLSIDDLLHKTGPLFIEFAYLRLLGRRPDAAGAARWESLLQDGYRREMFLWLVLSSAEARERSDRPYGADSLDLWVETQATVPELLLVEGEQFLELCYYRLLGREPDPIGVGRWAGLMRDGCRKEFVLLLLLREPEVRARQRVPGGAEVLNAWLREHAQVPELLQLRGQEFLEVCCRRVLQKGVDSAEATLWKKWLTDGCRPPFLLWLMLRRPEGQATEWEGTEAVDAWVQEYASVSELLLAEGTVFLDACYLRLLGRLPEADGAAYWKELRARGCSKEFLLWLMLRAAEVREMESPPLGKTTLEAMIWMRASVPEMLATDGLDFVEMCYRRLLGRAPDPQGASHWAQLLQKGCRKEILVWTLLHSREGQAARSHLSGAAALDAWIKANTTGSELVNACVPGRLRCQLWLARQWLQVSGSLYRLRGRFNAWLWSRGHTVPEPQPDLPEGDNPLAVPESPLRAA